MFGSMSVSGASRPAWAAGVIVRMGFLIYPTYRIVVLGIAAVSRSAAALRPALPHASSA